MKVCEAFRSLQGEGKKIGVPTFFIRSVGCNLRCAWCDTQYAMSEEGKDMSVEELMELVKDDKDVCLTGGEPMLQPDALEFIRRVSDAGKTMVLETNGSISLKDVPDRENIIISMDIKCPYSGMHEKMDFDNIALLKEKDQLKFVISDGIDLEYAISVIERYSPKCEVIFTPVGGMDIEPLAEEVVERRISARVLPQLHKIIWGNKRAV
ncbi:MAG: radical SAM protein [Candidatus Methanomethylophilaceae archaeon]|nr:radical SAM protein [Candidatus Methanomethylophilaceae archaeon]